LFTLNNNNQLLPINDIGVFDTSSKVQTLGNRMPESL
jgi:hypothetical protein